MSETEVPPGVQEATEPTREKSDDRGGHPAISAAVAEIRAADAPGTRSSSVAETPIVAIKPEVHQARFEELAGAFERGEFDRANEDGSVTKVTSYERHIDPMDRNDVALLREFRLRAAASGYREAFAPLVLPTLQVPEPGQTVAITGDHYASRPLTFVQFGYEKRVASRPKENNAP